MRISYWSSDVCSSDLTAARLRPSTATMRATRRRSRETGARDDRRRSPAYDQDRPSCGLTGCATRSEEHTSELQSLMRISYAVFCLKKNNKKKRETIRYIPSQQYYYTIPLPNNT